MKVQLIEPHVFPNVKENLDSMRNLLSALEPGVNMVVLPELWNCVYDNDCIRAAARFDKEALSLMRSQAACSKVWIIGGTIPWRENGSIYNRCFVIDASGAIVCHFDKLHLMEVHTAKGSYSEADVFTPGDDLVTFDTPWGKAGVLVCYDIRYPEPARLLAKEGIEYLFVPAAFNAHVGKLHWQALLTARAVENEIFVLGSSPDYTFGPYTAWGHSLVIDPFGEILLDGPGTAELFPARITEIRQRMPEWKIRRADLYEVIKKKKEG